MSFFDAIKPQRFSDQNVLHLERQAEVVVIKKLRNFAIPAVEDSSTGTEHDVFRREFFEFLGPRGLLRPSKPLDQKWSDPDGQLGSLYKHYYVSATSPGGVLGGIASKLVNRVGDDLGNGDVVSVRATVNTEGRGGCTVTINARAGKYQFQQNPFRKGQLLFESNDMVLVNLAGLDNKLHRVFTGFVTGARLQIATGNTLVTTIVLECEDSLKEMTQSRTPVRPSFTPALSGGKYFMGLDNDYSGRLPHDIMAEILGRAYCDLYATAGFRAKLAAIRAPVAGSPDEQTVTAAAVAENEEIKRRLPLPTPTQGVPFNVDGTYPFLAVVAASNPTATTGSLITAPVFQSAPQPTGQSTLLSQATVVPAKVYGFRRPKSSAAAIASGVTPLKAPSIQDAVNQGAPINAGDVDDLAFVISGTDQMAYKLAFLNATSLYVAEWRSGLALCREVADDINYEFFANENGTVLLRPLNITLPKNFKFSDKKLATASASQDGRVGTEYWLKTELMKDPQWTDTDDGVFTAAYACSDWQIGSQPSPFKGVACDLFRYQRLGARTAPVVTKIQLGDDVACEAYATSYLNRLNANASSAVINYTGDSRLRAGNPCYIPDRNVVYYISSVTHEFVAGQSYRTILNLKYGRRPAAVEDFAQARRGVGSADMINLLANRTFPALLSRLRKLGVQSKLIGAVVNGSPSQAEYLATYMENNKADLTFQGFIWEPLLPLDYESIRRNLADQRHMDLGKETALNYSVKSPAFFSVYQQVARTSSVAAISASGGSASVTQEALNRTKQRLWADEGFK